MRPLLGIILLFLNCIAFAQTTPAASEPVVAGKIELLEGEVRVFDRTKKARTVKVGDVVHEGDSVETGANGELHLAMEDDGFIAVRPNTKMRIIQYRAQGDDQDKGVIGLLTGSLRSVSGWIGKYHPKSYAIRTKTATIGIRGTDHEPTVIPEGSKEGEPGTYDKVNVGATYIQSAAGRIDVPEKKAAFAPFSGQRAARPRLLDHVPGFFRRTRNEQVIEKKHEAIHRFLEKRRDERRQMMRERIEARKQKRESMQERKQDKAEKRAERREQRAERHQDRGVQREERAAQRRQMREERMQQRQERRGGREAGNAREEKRKDREAGNKREERRKDRDNREGRRGGKD